MAEQEVWKDVKGYEGLYKISNFGRIKSFHKGKEKILNCKKIVSFVAKGKPRETYPIHRLVAEYFVPNPKNLPIVIHKNCDRSDNRASNLKWIGYTTEKYFCNREGYCDNQE